MRATTFLALAASAVLSASPALAQLATLRGTIPGSLHQCESTNVFFFQSGGIRPLTLVLLPEAVAAQAGANPTLDQVKALGPLQVVEGITTPDAQQSNFVLAIAAGESFESFAFLPDGTGKNLNLARTVQTALPNTPACNAATAASAKAAVAAPPAPSSSTPAAAAMTTTKKAKAVTTSAAALAAATTSSASLASIGRASSSSSSSSSSASAASTSSTPTSGAGKLSAGFAGVAIVGLVAAFAA
ncbi:hypothetical protein NBRC10512_002956 [Rhodotorula toruloides]|uniref:RHTO0S20e00342g1_1 n=2 Tax=Rhodotorula toruloides TaxID=5286 RepID=A0A061BFG9_RHOTO|nr:uncharacterized protein RHTO_04260 [Rhodotorula toruloides NP11]EMS19486.1 hypothetical protein RHTO_04260 [Rhodotorula toruloides NP11]CDR48740.1 RHTO0S20e00342g1_1 [Rhodotorula toruloides]